MPSTLVTHAWFHTCMVSFQPCVPCPVLRSLSVTDGCFGPVLASASAPSFHFTVFSSVGKSGQLKRLELLSHCSSRNLATPATSSCLQPHHTAGQGPALAVTWACSSVGIQGLPLEPGHCTLTSFHGSQLPSAHRMPVPLSPQDAGSPQTT